MGQSSPGHRDLYKRDVKKLLMIKTENYLNFESFQHAFPCAYAVSGPLLVICTVLRVISYNRLTRSNVHLCTGGCVSGLFIAQAVHTPVITHGIVVQTLRLPLNIFTALSIMTHKAVLPARAVVYSHYRMVQGRLPGQVGVPAGGGGAFWGTGWDPGGWSSGVQDPGAAARPPGGYFGEPSTGSTREQRSRPRRRLLHRCHLQRSDTEKAQRERFARRTAQLSSTLSPFFFFFTAGRRNVGKKIKKKNR